MKFSVAMCTYNGERYLSEQLKSIAEQNVLPGELVVCDDVSSDSTIEILQNYADSVPFPVQIHQNEENLGSTRNFEKAIKLCTGDIIVLTDQDDIWYKHKLEVLQKIFAQDGTLGFVSSDADLIDNQSESINKKLWESVYFHSDLQEKVKEGRLFQVLVKQNYVTGATMAFRAKYRDYLFPISSLWVHDGWIAIILSLLSNGRLIQDPLIQYREHGSNQIGTSNRNLPEWILHARKTPAGLFEEKKKAIEDLKEHIQQFALPNNAEIQAELEAKARHMSVRAQVTGGNILDVRFIIYELLAGRYQRYSMGGSKAALRDLVTLL